MKRLISLFIFIVTITSCGKAPIFNHTDELPGSEEVKGFFSADSRLHLSRFDLYVEPHWILPPTAYVESRVLILLFNKNGQLTDLPANKVLKSFVWMESMGHGGGNGRAERIAQGTYLVKKIGFNMGGPWELHLRVKENGALLDEVILRLKVAE